MGNWESIHPTIAINNKNGQTQTSDETFPMREGARDARRRGRKGTKKKKEKRKKTNEK